MAATVSATPQTQPAATADSPMQLSEGNLLKNKTNHILIIRGMYRHLEQAKVSFGTLGSIDIRRNADKLNSATQVALDMIEDNAEWLQFIEQEKRLTAIKPWNIPDNFVQKAYDEAGNIIQILATLGKDEGFEPDVLLSTIGCPKAKNRSGWKTYADCKTIQRTLEIVLKQQKG